MYKEPELQEIADLGPEPCGPDGQLCSMETGEYGTDYVSQCPVHRAQWLKELEEHHMYEDLSRNDKGDN